MISSLWRSLSLVFLLFALLLDIKNLSLANTIDYTLTLKSTPKTLSFKSSELLLRKDLKTIQIPQDPAYEGEARTYQAVALGSLLKDLKLPEDTVLQFQCIDGFSAPISFKKVMNEDPKGAIAYIAIESPTAKWPPLNSQSQKASAGPFYLVWMNPHLSRIAREEWPYQLSAFEAKKPLHETYPEIFPKASLGKEHSIHRGFKTFIKNCFPCHTMNFQGSSQLGPDLNVPMNPTEYLLPSALIALIRDPQAVRHWPLSKMHGFPKNELTDAELNDLISYLKHMSERKVQKKPKGFKS